MAENSTPSADTKSTGASKYIKLLPIIIPAIIIIIIAVIFIWIKVWNKGIPYEIDPNLILEADTEDALFLAPLEDVWGADDDGKRNIVIFGNDTVSKYTGEDDIADIIAEETNATVYNCGFPGSMLSASIPSWDEDYKEPLDTFSFFWLSDSMGLKDFSRQHTALDLLGDRVDTEVYQKQLKTLESIDFSTIDLVLVFYDASDFCLGADTYNEKEPYNLTTICGSYIATFDKFTVNYPNIQLMIVSPNFCYKTDKDGNRTPCDLGADSLTNCLTKVRAYCIASEISYLDNYYGVEINETNADQYLMEDGYTLNQIGRNMVAVRTAKFINLYWSKPE